MPYTTESAVTVAAGKAEIRQYRWDQPLDDEFCDDAPVFGLSLSRVPQGSLARSRNIRRLREFRPVGQMMYRPAGAAIQCVNAGGTQRLLICTLNQKADGWPETVMRRIDEAQPAIGLHHPTMVATMRSLAAEVAAPGFASEAMAEALIVMITVQFARSMGPGEGHGRVQGGLAPWQLKRIDDAVAGFETEAPSVSGLAEMLGVSPRHLLRAFRASRGLSVADYIAKMRVDRACTLIEEGAMPLKQVASRCGFSTAGGFSTAFTRAVGCSPQSYRSKAAFRVRYDSG